MPTDSATLDLETHDVHLPLVHLRTVQGMLDQLDSDDGQSRGGALGQQAARHATLEALRALVGGLHEADQAELLEKLSGDRRILLLTLAQPSLKAESFLHLHEPLREDIVAHLSPIEAARIVAELDSDDALDLVLSLDVEHRTEIMRNLSAKVRSLVEQGLNFPEDSAGRLAQRELVAFPHFWTVGKVVDFFRATAEDLPEYFSDIYVVDSAHRVTGVVPLSRIVRARRTIKLADIAEADLHTIPAEMDQEEVAHIFRRHNLDSAPVVDSAGRLIGAITLDDVVDVIDEEAEEDILKLAGLAETDLYSAVIQTTRSRFSWLFINLLTAIMASIVIGLFRGSIEKIVALAVLMPIVASMGGNAGTQTLTIVVRALATRELSAANAWRVVGKELSVGFLNGCLFAILMGTIAGGWFQDPNLGLVIGAAMMINLIAAGVFGALIPVTLHRLKIDPAVSSAVFLTTVTDIVGFLAFLGLASLILL